MRTVLPTLLVIFSSLIGCSRSVSISNSPLLSADLSELQQDKSQLPTLVFIRPGVPDLSHYRAFIVDDVRFRYLENTPHKVSPKTIAFAQQYFRKALVDALLAGGYEVRDTPAVNTLRISLAIADLEMPLGVSPEMATALGQRIEVGSVTIMAAFTEAVSLRIDAVVMEQARGRSLLTDKPWSNTADIESAFDLWAQGIRSAIDSANARKQIQ